MQKNRTERAYKLVVYKDNVTGKIKAIGAAGWERLKNKTAGSGKRVQPRYKKITGKAAETFLAKRASAGAFSPKSEEDKQQEAKEANAQNAIIKALRNKKVPLERDGDEVILTETIKEEGKEPQVNETRMHYKKAQKDEAFVAKVEKLLSECKGCR